MYFVFFFTGRVGVGGESTVGMNLQTPQFTVFYVGSPGNQYKCGGSGLFCSLDTGSSIVVMILVGMVPIDSCV